MAGTKFRLVAESEENHLRKLAAIVNQRLDQLDGKTPRTATPTQLLALVALGLVDDLLASEERVMRISELTRSAVANAIERIDRRIAAEPASAETEQTEGPDGG
jgi:cell division protein ZapA (FtsZ GTPase activity inhibitor)